MKRQQSAKEAAQRLAMSMATSADDEEGDDLLDDFEPVVPSGGLGLGLAGGRQAKNRLKMLQDSVEEAEPASPRSNAPGRSLSYANSFGAAEQPLSARSIGLIGRPNLRIRTASFVPPVVPLPNKPVQYGTPTESQRDKNRDKRSALDFGSFKYKEPFGAQQSSALQDELDMLQEENDSLLEKLRLTEERCEEAESRSRQLERQIASLGEGVSLESRLLSRKEADLQKREAALKVASEHFGGGGDAVVALREEAETARNEASSLRVTTQRTVLSQDEMEEVVLKRCWLARCWSLCVQYGIHGEIAEARHEYWSRYAWRPVEILLATGRKAKDENLMINSHLEEREKVLEHLKKRPTVESMLLVEKGLRELGELKVEEAIVISMAQKRGQSMVKHGATGADELKLPGDWCSYAEAFELTPDEVEDVLLKKALLLYFWRRAKKTGLETEVAEERLKYWIKQGDKRPNSHDAVDVDRGLVELRKLAVETKLWEEAHSLFDPHDSEQTLLEAEYKILPCS